MMRIFPHFIFQDFVQGKDEEHGLLKLRGEFLGEETYWRREIFEEGCLEEWLISEGTLQEWAHKREGSQ